MKTSVTYPETEMSDDCFPERPGSRATRLGPDRYHLILSFCIFSVAA